MESIRLPISISAVSTIFNSGECVECSREKCARHNGNENKFVSHPVLNESQTDID